MIGAPDVNVIDAILDQAARRPDAPAIVLAHETLGFAAFARSLAGAAAGLGAAGVPPGAVVAVMAGDPYPSFRAMLGVMLCGRTLLALDRDMSEAEMRRLIAATGASVLVAERDVALPGVRLLDMAELPGEGDPAQERAPGGDRIAQIVVSSGTTGPSKAAPATHRELAQRIADRARESGIDAATCHRVVVGVGFVLGRYPAMRTLDAGGRVIFRPMPGSVPELVRSLAEDGVTYLALTPAHVATLLDGLPAGDGPALPTVRTLTVTSAALSRAMRRAVLDRLTPNLHIAYASNEVGPITHARPEDLARHLMTVGPPLPGVAIEIVDDDGQPVPPGELGEIRVRTPSMTRGYIGDEAAQRAIRDGWFHMGDTGRLDEGGHLYLHGRIDDRINYGGRKLYAFEIEEILLSHPAVAEAAAVGLPSRRHQEVPVAAVVVRRPVPERELIAHCAARLESWKVPRLIRSLAELPRTPNRKLARSELRRIMTTMLAPPGTDTR
ncbi:class I adenylate-forming enzyme family protein [Stella sp.]|uniref:class I adenylate-forming enzyme family protein n=1 Tax=Stella sp. TaxID=2912054 RepID=UPI0035AF0BEC